MLKDNELHMSLSNATDAPIIGSPIGYQLYWPFFSSGIELAQI